MFGLTQENTLNQALLYIATADTPRSYIVQTDSGRQIRRNRQHLNVVPDHSEPTSTTNEQVPPTARDTIQPPHTDGDTIPEREMWKRIYITIEGVKSNYSMNRLLFVRVTVSINTQLSCM